MQPLKVTQKVKISPGAIYHDTSGGVLLFDPDTSEIYSLNETASFIWRRCKNSVTIHKIINHLISHYKVDCVEAKKDVLDFIHTYLANKFLVLTDK